MPRARRRHVADLHHAHWLRGYDAGQGAAEAAGATSATRCAAASAPVEL